MSAAARTSHLSKLDAWRGVAILSVFLFHFVGQVFGWQFLAWNGPWRDYHYVTDRTFFLFYPLSYGWVGVPLFFVLSGFVIHYSFLNAKHHETLSFYWRRFWRIYPPYLLALLVFCVWNRLDMTSTAGRLQLLTHLFAVHNFHDDYLYGINSSFWSLATEIQFYLLYPLVLIWRRKLSMNSVLWPTLMLSLSLRILALVTTDWKTSPSYAIWQSTPILWFDWILGACLAESYRNGRRLLPNSKSLLSIVTLLFFVSFHYQPTSFFSFTLASVIAAFVLERALWNQQELGRLGRLLVPLGLCSYSFYLWHQPFLPYLNGLLGKTGLPEVWWVTMTLGLSLNFVVIFALSWLSYSTVERGSPVVGKWLWSLLAKRQTQAVIGKVVEAGAGTAERDGLRKAS